MTILVTGATGNIGRCLVHRLVDAGQAVRAMTRAPHTARLPAAVDVRYGDFEQPDTWAEVLDGVDRVYLFPHIYDVETPGGHFVDRAVRTGARRFVVHSAVAAGFTGDEPADPGLHHLKRHLAVERRAHRELERWVEATGAEWTHLRPGLLAVNALSWAESIRTERVVREPYPASGYPWVHEADIAEVAVAALLTDAHVGAAYTLTGPAKVTQAEQVRAIAAAIGEAIAFEELSPQQAREQWLRDGYPAEYVDWMLELRIDSLEGPGCIPPTDTFHRITGRAPRSFAQWAADHRADFQPLSASPE
ncbi:NAD(P)H-binding protein [Nocardia wallacei]|uniref:Nucleotide-diphosphate-sugar epimerase n=1 Tax=Nocardia wallacei TaxID=480035 RepID=A0A7G1KFN6_9NOCA|nr:NAD(P)H-binding protein [Nocardia wallacei]BCK53780.1 nucleotide-diphosphate-sugar epimerase [Nocardia wallacei]